jgi:hypothetical protein
LPLLITFLKSYSRPYLGISSTAATGQVTSANGDCSLSADAQQKATSASVVTNEAEELIEKDIRDRFKKMCDGYFGDVSKILVKDHVVGVALFMSKRGWTLILFPCSVFKNKTGEIMRHIFALGRYLRIGSKHMKR